MATTKSGRVREFLFLGTGTSGSVPNIHCLIDKPTPTCKVCLSAIKFEPPSAASVAQLPQYSKNRRRNTSGIVRFMHSDGRMRNVLIDCGKTFYDAALTWFVEYRLRNIDAVLITHGHADAIMGLDDLRQWTIGGETHALQDHVDIYLTQETMDVVERAFPYMVDRRLATGGGDVPRVQFRVIKTGSDGPLSFTIDNELEVIPFEVEHGKSGSNPYMSLGFRFENLTYVSDANAFPTRAVDIVRGSKYLIIDALRPEPHTSHFSFTQALDECVRGLCRGGRGYFTGLTHAVDHDDVNAIIQKDGRLVECGIHVECAYDGQRVFVGGDDGMCVSRI